MKKTDISQEIFKFSIHKEAFVCIYNLQSIFLFLGQSYSLRLHYVLY